MPDERRRQEQLLRRSHPCRETGSFRFVRVESLVAHSGVLIETTESLNDK